MRDRLTGRVARVEGDVEDTDIFKCTNRSCGYEAPYKDVKKPGAIAQCPKCRKFMYNTYPGTDDVKASLSTKTMPSKWNPSNFKKIPYKPGDGSPQGWLKKKGPHTFIDEFGDDFDSDDLQWNCPKCQSRYNDAGYPCDCGEPSPYHIKSAHTASLDLIASELEKMDPRLALAIDQISDRLEGNM